MKASVVRWSWCALVAAALLPSDGAAQMVDYVIDPGGTIASFEISLFGIFTRQGRFDHKEGVVSVDRPAREGRVDITIDVSSVNTASEAFDQQLKSVDLFHTGRYPLARFVSDSVVFDGEAVAAVHGQFTLRGETRPVTLKATRFSCQDSPGHRREVCRGRFETTIDRTAYGMDYGVQWGLSKDVRLLIDVEAFRR